ncbi:tubulin epsilon and delta complex protein 1 isoform X2 [Cynoglossus semilaevis]|uniref:tubulin epsilon and delta complex protein 1 isoform X2 n=1 Tax=Cynoglossus semilaevis TaxID=244447 RepID=UPI000D62C930|nr:tubulin epsilon and delta complex protein 1 isoform X2 [Cynoglossus semilaevis]
MQRRKASASVEVKQVIATLCRLLAATGLDVVPTPESFRRAKFGDGPEVEGQFWQLLTNIFQIIDDVPVEVTDQPMRAPVQRQVVAAGLRLSGFHADWLCGRKEEGKSFSSRDLLLAVSWLFATGTLEKLLMHRVQRLDNTLLTLRPVKTPVCLDLQFDPSSLRRLQWLRGSLRHQQRILLSILEERARLLHTVFSASLSSTVSSSAVDPDCSAIKHDSVCVKQLCDLLQSYLNWKQVESVFWSWMDSVMDCHHVVSVVKEPQLITNVCQHGNQEQENTLGLHTAQVIETPLTHTHTSLSVSSWSDELLFYKLTPLSLH